MVPKINKIMYIYIPHTQDIRFQKNFGQIFASRVQEVALKLPYEAENIHITIFSHYQNSSHLISYRNIFGRFLTTLT